MIIEVIYMRDIIKKGVSQPHRIPTSLLNNTINYYVGRKYYDLVHSSDEFRSLADQTWEFTDTIEHLNPDLIEELVPNKNLPLCGGTNFQFRRPFVCEIRDCELVGPFAAGKTRYNKYIEDMLGRPFSHGDLHGRVKKTLLADYRLHFTRESPDSHRCAAVVHRASGSQNYYHWLIDHLLKLRGIERYERETEQQVTIIRSKHTPDFAKEAFELLGFGGHQMVEWDESCRVEIDRLVVPSWPEPTPGALKWLRESVGALDRDETADNWLYISRQNASRGRTVVNFEEVQSVLNEFDVEVVRPEKWSISKQISEFAAADGIIGPHGAGLTNMIWGDNITVIELFGERVKGPFYVLAHLLDHEYHALFGAEIPDEKVSIPLYHNLLVPIDELREMLVKMR